MQTRPTPTRAPATPNLAGFGTTTTYPRPRRRRLSLAFAVAVVIALATAAGVVAVSLSRSDTRRTYIAATGWPAHGQAAVQVGGGQLDLSPGQAPVPIASLAKVMTAYLVLREAPLQGDEAGPELRVTAADVADTQRRQINDESVVAVADGEMLSERQALLAVLLPSANNVAVMLARQTAGSVATFVGWMNTTARHLGMTDTVYTDPSGLDEGTRSTARDQVLLAGAAMHDDVFAALVAQQEAELPVVGTVHNTDTLLGTAGFVGIKTGSDDAAGGCYMFRTWRVIDGEVRAVTGVVLGQPGDNLIDAGLAAGRQLADKIALKVPQG
ncbi:MAG: hypothetical protein QOE97_320 [Pseudonocardiales bacterium]|nr:hypothetical protein [Pseudonocardiales bacterium]